LSKEYTTITGQNTYDIAIEQYGTLNNMDQIMRQVPDLNQPVPFGTVLTINKTENNVALRFITNDIRVSTGDKSEIAQIYQTFDETFDETFK